MTATLAPTIAQEEIDAAALLTLQAAFQARDQRQFKAEAQAVDWALHSPEALLRTIEMAVTLGLITVAVALAEQGTALFPEHQPLDAAARVLAPPTAQIVPGEPAKGLDASRAWLQQYAENYHGQWIAVSQGQLLGAAPTLQQLRALIGQPEDAQSTIIVRVLCDK